MFLNPAEQPYFCANCSDAQMLGEAFLAEPILGKTQVFQFFLNKLMCLLFPI